MTSERQQQVERICQEALDRQGAARLAYLSDACSGDAHLRREVESLLSFEDAAEHFIEAPAVEHVARTLAGSAAFKAGSRVGSYEIVSALGAGGMGEVYRAHDTKLRRDVAIKVLPPLLLSDASRRARFEREARLLAALNHPHVGAIYGIDESSGVQALILELVEGDTLQDLLSRSPCGRLPVERALRIAKQIAEALEAAHEKGIIHRDLKPSNIKVTADGDVKVLDFGLATALAVQDGDGGDLSSSMANVPHPIVGTAAYMSPEQAQGLPTDRRTDVWAFGCVLFEMLSGARPFGGDSSAATLANVVARDPEWSVLPEALAPSIRKLLRRCLQKERRQRLADIADARLEIEETLSGSIGSDWTDPSRHRGRERVAWGAAAASAVVLAGTFVYFGRIERPPPELVTFEVPAPQIAAPFFMSVSPDGRHIAYNVTGGGVRVHSMDRNEARFLPGTERAFHADWSPDSRFIVFPADGKLKKVDIRGGLPQTLTDAPGVFRRSAWSREGVILFANPQTIRRVADIGGASSTATELDISLEESYHSTPSFLPDGRHFLYTAWHDTDAERRAVYVGSLDSRSRVRLVTADSKAMYSPPGFLLFRQGDTLMARPFDATRRRFTGDPQPLVEGVHYNPSLGQTAFSVSLQGTLAYVLNATTRLRLTWVDRNGTITPVSGTQIDADFALSPRLSSDGSRAAFQRGADIWIYDITRDQAIRLTNNASADRFPIWSPDGSQLVFGSNRNTPSGEALYIMSSNGAAGERAVQPGKPGNAMVPRDWARDGESVVLETGGAFGQQRDIGILRLSAGGAPVTYLATPVDERDPALSPDGRWLAYASNESGIHQIVVRTFPDPTVEKITVGSGRFPRWKGDGRELYYIDSKGKMVAASVATSPTFRVISTTPLFDAPYVPDVTNLDIPYDVTHDGRRFLMSMPVGAPSSAGPTAITVVRGWTALLEN